MFDIKEKYSRAGIESRIFNINGEVT